MKVIFFTEGGKKFGFGHAVRCAALLEAFQEQGIHSKFIVNAGQSLDGILGDIKHHICDWTSVHAKALNAVSRDDIVIIDSYFADLEFYKEASKAARVAVYLDDLNRIKYPRGIVLNSAIYAEELGYSHDHENVYLLGPQYISLRKLYWDIPVKKRAEDVKKVLMTFGGMDFSGLTQRIVDHFDGKASFVFETIHSSGTKMHSSGLFQAIQEADLCISGGGQTVYNLARCGLPTIGVCLAKNQMMNLDWWDKTKFLKYAGWHEDGDLPGKIENILKAPDFGDFLRKGSLGLKYVDGQGARRVVEAILLNLNRKDLKYAATQC